LIDGKRPKNNDPIRSKTGIDDLIYQTSQTDSDTVTDGVGFVLTEDDDGCCASVGVVQRNKELHNSPKRKYLFLGMAWQLEETMMLSRLFLEANTLNHCDLWRHRDVARMLKAAEFGYDKVYSLDWKVLLSSRHFCIDLSVPGCSPDVKRFKSHLFSEISLDFIWMPTSYISDTVLRASFYSSTIPLFAEILEELGRIYLPAMPNVFGRLSKNWDQLSKVFLLRYIREDQMEESTLYQATVSLPMHKLGKQSASQQVLKYGLTYEEVKATTCSARTLRDLIPHYRVGEVRVRFLCLMRL